MITVNRNLPSLANLSDQGCAGLLHCFCPSLVRLTLMFDANRIQVRVYIRPYKFPDRSVHSASVPGGVILLHVLVDFAAFSDPVVCAYLRSGVGKPRVSAR